MKRKAIDTRKFIREAENKGVSVYLLIKRYLRYRKRDPGMKVHNCSKCKFSDSVKFYNCEKKVIQCHWIGICKHFYANVDSKHICDNFEHSHRKDLEEI